MQEQVATLENEHAAARGELASELMRVKEQSARESEALGAATVRDSVAFDCCLVGTAVGILVMAY